MTLEELLAQAGQMQPPEMQPQGLDLASLMAPTMPPADFSGFQPGGQVQEPDLTMSPLHANFLDRLGLAFQQLQPINTQYSGAASGLQGLMQGFGAARGGEFQRAQAANTAENARLSESARHMAQTRWQNHQLAVQQIAAERRSAQEQVTNDRLARSEKRSQAYLDLATRKASEPVGGALPYSPTVEGIYEGTFPPTMLSTTRPTKYSIGLSNEMRNAHPDFNVTKALMQYNAVAKQVQGLNSTQMVNLQQRIATAEPTLENVKALNEQLKGMIPRTAITKVNQVGLGAVLNGAYGRDAQQLASQLQTQIGILKTEVPTILNGGYAPLEANYRQADKMIDAAWGPDRIDNGVSTIKLDMNWRKAAMGQTSATLPQGFGAAPNPYGGQPGQAAPVSDAQAQAEYDALVRARKK